MYGPQHERSQQESRLKPFIQEQAKTSGHLREPWYGMHNLGGCKFTQICSFTYPNTLIKNLEFSS